MRKKKKKIKQTNKMTMKTGVSLHRCVLQALTSSIHI